MGFVHPVRDLVTHGGAGYLFKWREESLLFWFEIVMFVIASIFLLRQSKVRNNPNALYGTCALVVMGFIAKSAECLEHGVPGEVGLLLCSQVD